MSSTDTIIIGGGHNGLICATLLAKAGQKVVLVEAADRLGGLARDREFHPGFKASVAQTLYALPTSVIKALDLEQQGFIPSKETLTTTALSLTEPPITLAGARIVGACQTDAAAFAITKSSSPPLAKPSRPFGLKPCHALAPQAFKICSPLDTSG